MEKSNLKKKNHRENVPELKGQEKTYYNRLKKKKKDSNQGLASKNGSTLEIKIIKSVRWKNNNKNVSHTENQEWGGTDSVATLEVKRPLQQRLQMPRILNPTKISTWDESTLQTIPDVKASENLPFMHLFSESQENVFHQNERAN